MSARLIYYIRAGISGPIKIGVSENVAKRLHGLRVANAEFLQPGMAAEPWDWLTSSSPRKSYKLGNSLEVCLRPMSPSRSSAVRGEA